MQYHIHPQSCSTFLAPGARGFLQLHPFHGNREHFLEDLHASPTMQLLPQVPIQLPVCLHLAAQLHIPHTLKVSQQ